MRQLGIPVLLVFAAWLVAGLGFASSAIPQQEVRLAFLGDTGTGDERQERVRDALLRVATDSGVQQVFFLGDNVYENGEAARFEDRFLGMYRPIMELGVQLHAALGNHDVRKCAASGAVPLPRDGSAYRAAPNCWASQQLGTAEFGYVNGNRYYSVATPGPEPLVEVFVLDTNTLEVEQTKLKDRLDEAQLSWLRSALGASRAAWKVVAMHHPMYSPEGDRFLRSGHAGEEELRRRLEPILVDAGVNVVFQGHNHLYARLEPQHGIRYFVAGAGGAKPYRFKRDAITVRRDDMGRFNHFIYVTVTRAAFEYCVIDDSARVRDEGRLEPGGATDNSGVCERSHAR